MSTAEIKLFLQFLGDCIKVTIFAQFITFINN